MGKDLVAILITNEAGGQLFYFPPDEWERLERDFASFQTNNYPTAGTYRHWLPKSQSGATPRARLWHRLAGRERAGRLDLEFAGASIISGQ